MQESSVQKIYSIIQNICLSKQSLKLGSVPDQQGSQNNSTSIFLCFVSLFTQQKAPTADNKRALSISQLTYIMAHEPLNLILRLIFKSG